VPDDAGQKIETGKYISTIFEAISKPLVVEWLQAGLRFNSKYFGNVLVVTLSKKFWPPMGISQQKDCSSIGRMPSPMIDVLSIKKSSEWLIHPIPWK
jgi:hypothetical protein